MATVSSNGHRAERISSPACSPNVVTRRSTAYAQSKLANLMFTYKLGAAPAEAGAATIALAAHPGTASTELVGHIPGVLRSAYAATRSLFTQSAAMGALPMLRAATDPAARGGEYYDLADWAR